MGIVKNLMVRCGADFSELEKGGQKAKTTMTNMERAVASATKKMEKDFDGMDRELKGLFDDVDTSKLEKELKQGGQAAELAARKIEMALNGMGKSTHRVIGRVCRSHDEVHVFEPIGKSAHEGIHGIDGHGVGVFAARRLRPVPDA